MAVTVVLEAWKVVGVAAVALEMPVVTAAIVAVVRSVPVMHRSTKPCCIK